MVMFVDLRKDRVKAFLFILMIMSVGPKKEHFFLERVLELTIFFSIYHIFLLMYVGLRNDHLPHIYIYILVPATHKNIFPQLTHVSSTDVTILNTLGITNI